MICISQEWIRYHTEASWFTLKKQQVRFHEDKFVVTLNLLTGRQFSRDEMTPPGESSLLGPQAGAQDVGP